MATTESFGKLLADHRKKKKLTQTQLAASVGLSVSYLNRIEKGTRKPPSLSAVEALIGELNLPPHDEERFRAAAGYPSVDTPLPPRSFPVGVTIAEVEDYYAELRDQGLIRDAAEVAYILAKAHARGGNKERVKQYRDESIALFEQLDVNSRNQAISRFDGLLGIGVPQFIHEGTVRRFLADII